MDCVLGRHLWANKHPVGLGIAVLGVADGSWEAAMPRFLQ